VGDRVLGHGAVERVGRVLDDGDATAPPKCAQACRPVVEYSGEDETDRRSTVRVGRRAKQRVDGRPVAVLRRPAVDADDAVLDEQMAVRWRDVDS
jgi:hypothetical protein